MHMLKYPNAPDRETAMIPASAIKYHVSRKSETVIIRKEYPGALAWEPDVAVRYRDHHVADRVCRMLMADQSGQRVKRYWEIKRAAFEITNGVNAFKDGAKALEVDGTKSLGQVIRESVAKRPA